MGTMDHYILWRFIMAASKMAKQYCRNTNSFKSQQRCSALIFGSEYEYGVNVDYDSNVFIDIWARQANLCLRAFSHDKS